MGSAVYGWPPICREQIKLKSPALRGQRKLQQAPKTAPAKPETTVAVEAPEVKIASEPKTVIEEVSTPAPEVVATPVEIKAPEVATPQVDLNAFLGKLMSPDFEEQAKAMESIAEMAQNTPKAATELLDEKIINTLLAIVEKNSGTLVGPTPQQLQIREKMMAGQTVTDTEKLEAETITPMEQAERNKQYSMYTIAILQKLYSTEVEEMNNTIVPLTELPGAAGIVEQVKNNPNPMVRASGVDALSYIQKPEYKQDLTTLFTIAQNDKDVNVRQAAAKGLEKLAQLEAPKAQTPAVEAEKIA